MKVAITGSDGFIGRHLHRALSQSHAVHSLRRDRCDLLKPHTLEEFVSGMDCIVHLAALNRAEHWPMFEVNVMGTLGLLEAIGCFNPGCTLIFASSFQVYAPQSPEVQVREDSALAPTSFYGLTKCLSERTIQHYAQDGLLRAIILRLANVYGPGCRPYYNSAIATFAERAVHREPLEVSNPLSARDFIYIEDVVQAFAKAVEHQPQGVDIFNVCSGQLSTLEEIVAVVNRHIQVEAKCGPVRTEPVICGDPTVSERILGFVARVNLWEGIQRTLAWRQRRENVGEGTTHH